MAKKAKRVSWRTLARHAEKAAGKNLPKARRLRAESAALRRSERAVKATASIALRNIAGAKRAAQGWATRRANEAKKAMKAGGLGALVAQAPAAQQGIDRQNKSWREMVFNPNASLADTRAAEDVGTNRGAPGRGELVGGGFSQLADQIIKLARKKGGADDIQNELAALAASSKYEGCVETDKAATKRLIETQQIMADRIVCGFLAEMEHTMNFHRGFPPGMVLSVDAHTITKIIDALNKAGYRATGRVNTGAVMGTERGT